MRIKNVKMERPDDQTLDYVPCLVDKKNRVIFNLWFDEPMIGRQGGFTKPLGTYNKKRRKPGKSAPDNVVGYVEITCLNPETQEYV